VDARSPAQVRICLVPDTDIGDTVASGGVRRLSLRLDKPRSAKPEKRMLIRLPYPLLHSTTAKWREIVL
jgi:hypothetical protein